MSAATRTQTRYCPLSSCRFGSMNRPTVAMYRVPRPSSASPTGVKSNRRNGCKPFCSRAALTRTQPTPAVEMTRGGQRSARAPATGATQLALDPLELIHRLAQQIPDPGQHLVRYYGAYSNRARGQRRKAESRLEGNGSGEAEEPIPPPPERAALRRRWANLIRRVYEVDPLVCPRCGSEMRIVSFITEPPTYCP